MTKRSHSLSLSASLSTSVVLLLALAPAARADMTTKAQCIEANTKGQDLRRDGNLSAARDQFRACANAVCPAMIRRDCTKRFDEVESAQPTIVFDAKDGSGRDLSAVTVTVDGHPLADRLDGTALRADPGEHVFVFTVAGEAPVSQTMVLREGDKERREHIVIGPVVAPPTTPPVPESTTPSIRPEGHEGSSGGAGGGSGTQKVLGLVVGGVGLAGIGVGSAFGLMTLSQADKQKTDCASATSCNDPAQAASDHSTGTTDRTISMISFIAGGALLVGGVVIFLTAGHSSVAPEGAGLLVVPSVGPGSGGMSVMGRF